MKAVTMEIETPFLEGVIVDVGLGYVREMTT